MRIMNAIHAAATIYLFALTLFSQNTFAQNFGDELIRCVVQKNSDKKLSPEIALRQFQEACTKEVEAARESGNNKFKGPEIFSPEEVAEIISESESPENLRKQWLNCVEWLAHHWDDGISQAGDIATTISYECQSEYDKFGDRWLTGELLKDYKNSRVTYTRHIALKTILSNRSTRRGQ